MSETQKIETNFDGLMLAPGASGAVKGDWVTPDEYNRLKRERDERNARADAAWLATHPGARIVDGKLHP